MRLDSVVSLTASILIGYSGLTTKLSERNPVGTVAAPVVNKM